jgi:hypothetical protein
MLQAVLIVLAAGLVNDTTNIQLAFSCVSCRLYETYTMGRKAVQERPLHIFNGLKYRQQANLVLHCSGYSYNAVAIACTSVRTIARCVC